MHVVSLEQPSGVELQFAEFVDCARRRHPEWLHGWINPAGPVHDALAPLLNPALAASIDAKHRWGIKLPSKPELVRTWHCRQALRRARATAVVVWNRTARTGFLLDAAGAERCIHWEHGAAWFGKREGERRRYLQRIPLAIANSTAAARILESFWEFPGEVKVVANALRPSVAPQAPVVRTAPPRSSIRLGVAARLVPVKGVAVALHVTKLLAAGGIPVELHIAGEGPERAPLQALAKRLGVDSRAHFHGRVDDMSRFYADIDCLLHLPLTEAFGLVAIEAAASGCPVVAAAVDGLTEAVASGITGYCVEPTLPLSAYVELGGSVAGMPVCVYDPAADRLREPRIVDPAVAAEAVRDLFSSESRYLRLAHSSSAHVLREFRFDRHVDEVLRIVDEFVGG